MTSAMTRLLKTSSTAQKMWKLMRYEEQHCDTRSQDKWFKIDPITLHIYNFLLTSFRKHLIISAILPRQPLLPHTVSLLHSWTFGELMSL